MEYSGSYPERSTNNAIMTKEEFTKRVKIVDSGCWEWQGAMSNTGYGIIKQGKRRTGAHRISYMFHIGTIPEKLMVCHTCDNRKCVNPEHFFLGTNADNMKDAFRKGRLKVPVTSQFKPGNIPVNRKISLDLMQQVINEINKKEKSIIQICRELNVSYNAVKDMRRTKSRTYKTLTK